MGSSADWTQLGKGSDILRIDQQKSSKLTLTHTRACEHTHIFLKIIQGCETYKVMSLRRRKEKEQGRKPCELATKTLPKIMQGIKSQM